MRHAIGSDPISRLERRLSRLGARLGGLEHRAGRLGESVYPSLRAELLDIDDELWRIDLRLASRGSDEALVAEELDDAESRLDGAERDIARAESVARHPARGDDARRRARRDASPSGRPAVRPAPRQLGEPAAA